MIIKKMICILIALILVASCAACGGEKKSAGDETTAVTTTSNQEQAASETVAQNNSTEPVKISYCLWATKEGINSVNEIGKKFNESQKNIQVEVNGIVPDVYWQKLNAYFASNTAPDVIQVAADYGDAFVSRGVFEPLDTFFTADPSLNDKWPKSLLDSLKVSDKLYALPIGTQVYFIAYNKKLFDEAKVAYPTDKWTEEEFVEIAKKLTDPSKKQYGVLVTGYVKDLPRELYGKPCYDVAGKKMLVEGNQEFKDAMQLLAVDLFNTYKVTPQSLSKKDLGGGFETGKYPMAFIAYWDIASLSTTIGKTFDWDIVRYPTSTKYNVRWKSPVYVQALSVSSKSKNKDAAFEFCKWWATDKLPQTSMSDSFPVCNQVINDPAFMNEFKEGKQYNKQVVIDTINEQGIAWWNTGVIGDINDNVIVPAIEKLILKPGETNLDKTISDIQKKGQEAFDKNK